MTLFASKDWAEKHPEGSLLLCTPRSGRQVLHAVEVKSITESIPGGDQIRIEIGDTLCASYVTSKGTLYQKAPKSIITVHMLIEGATHGDQEATWDDVVTGSGMVPIGPGGHRDARIYNRSRVCEQCYSVHVERTTPIDPDARDARLDVQSVLRTGRTLNASQRSALQKLIKNDFAQLGHDLTMQHRAWITAEADRIESEYRSDIELITLGSEKLANFTQVVRQMWDDVYAELRATGVDTRNGATYSMNVPSHLIVRAKEDALKEMHRKSNLALENAQLTLRKRELELERTVLLTAIDTEASRAFLEQIPAAKDVFATALGQPALG